MEARLFGISNKLRVVESELFIYVEQLPCVAVCHDRRPGILITAYNVSRQNKTRMYYFVIKARIFPKTYASEDVSCKNGVHLASIMTNNGLSTCKSSPP